MEYQSAPERPWRSVWFTQLSSGVYPTSNAPGVIVPLRSVRRSSVFLHFLHLKGYQWLKERVNSEEGRRQLIKIKELHLLADRLSCTAAQLAIGKTQTTHVCAVQAIQEAKRPFNSLWIKSFSSFFQPGVCAVRVSAQYFWVFLPLTSCLKTWGPCGYGIISDLLRRNGCVVWQIKVTFKVGYFLCLLLADFNSNDPTSRHGNRRPAGKQATLEERAALIKAPNLTDRQCFERARKIMTLGNVAFRSAVYSTCMSSATLRFQVCAHFHSAQ